MKAIVKSPNMPLELIIITDPYLKDTDADFVIVKNKFLGLCRTDLYVASGAIQINKPIIIGHEFSGYVVDIGKNINNIKINDLVGINPLINEQFLGLDIDGALCEFIKVHKDNVFIGNGISVKALAYLEPICASLAPLNANLNRNMQGLIFGKNRISELTYIIMKSMGFNVKIFNEETAGDVYNQFDYIIETNLSDLYVEKIIDMLKINGTLILKSRKVEKVSFPVNKLVKKNINIKSCSYYNYNEAIVWLKNNEDKISHLLGDSFAIENFLSAIEDATLSEAKKTFIEIF